MNYNNEANIVDYCSTPTSQFSKTEAIREIQQRIKPYIGVMPQSTFSNTIKGILNGTCKSETEERFFNTFGYKKQEVKWNYEEVKK
jgi:hypothetical protein